MGGGTFYRIRRARGQSPAAPPRTPAVLLASTRLGGRTVGYVCVYSAHHHHHLFALSASSLHHHSLLSTIMSTVSPEILWAQRSSPEEPEKNVVYLTINAPNLPPLNQGTTFHLTPSGFEFKADVTGGQGQGVEEKHYAFSLDFFAPVSVEESKIHLNSKVLFAVLRKQEAKEEFWPRLTKDKVRLHNVKTDFDKWVDEDEQDEDTSDPTAGMPPGSMCSFPLVYPPFYAFSSQLHSHD